MLSDHLRVLVVRRRQPLWPVLLLAGVPMAFMGLLGVGEGSSYFFVLAAICLLQAVYPTLLGWALVVAIYSICSALFVYVLAADLLRMARGHQTEVFVNPTDTAVFVTLVAVLLAITVIIVLNRPEQFSR